MQASWAPCAPCQQAGFPSYPPPRTRHTIAACYRRRDRLISHPKAVSTKNGQLVRGLRAARANERRCRKRASVFNIKCISLVYSTAHRATYKHTELNNVGIVNKYCHPQAVHMPAAPLVYNDVHHTVADDLHNTNGDLVTVHELLGHASVQTTAPHDRHGEWAKHQVGGRWRCPIRSPSVRPTTVPCSPQHWRRSRARALARGSVTTVVGRRPIAWGRPAAQRSVGPGHQHGVASARKSGTDA